MAVVVIWLLFWCVITGDDGDIMDPAEIPLCQEYAGTGQCSAGDDCLYIHGDECEVGGKIIES